MTDFRQIKTLREDLHSQPEKAWCEFRTCAKVADLLSRLDGWELHMGREIFDESKALGRPDLNELNENEARALRDKNVKPEFIARMQKLPGIVAVLDTGKSGPVTAFRFDMDCVEVSEANNLKFKSQRAGLMHACGHDAHTAIGVGLASLLSEIKNNLTGKIKLIFQPGEEGCRGAYAMAERGVVDDVDYFFGMHIGGGVPTGTFGINSYGFLATQKVDVKFTGVSAHAAASPDKGRNALLAAAQAALALHAIAPRPDGLMRVNVGVLNAGTGRNVVPGEALLKFEVRGETQEILNYAAEKSREIMKGAAAMYGVEAELINVGLGATATGDQDLADKVKAIVLASGLFANVIDKIRAVGSEDATWFMLRVQAHGGKAIYMGLGSDIAAPHHNSKFNIDEASLEPGARVLAEIAKAINN